MTEWFSSISPSYQKSSSNLGICLHANMLVRMFPESSIGATVCKRTQEISATVGLLGSLGHHQLGNQSNLASDSSGPAAAENSSLDFADDNVFNNQLFASCHQSSDNEDDWDAMAATPCGGSCNLAPDYDSENCLAAAPATPAGTGTAANEIVPTSKSASSDEYPHDFVELAHDVLAAATTCPETAVPTSGLSDNIVCPNSAVDVGQLQQLVAEAADVSTEAAPDLRRKRQRKVVAQVGSTSNPGMDHGARRRNRG